MDGFTPALRKFVGKAILMARSASRYQRALDRQKATGRVGNMSTEELQYVTDRLWQEFNSAFKEMEREYDAMMQSPKD